MGVSTNRITSVLACAGCVLLALAFSHAGLELVSRFAEVRLDAYPWQEDGHRQVLTSTNYTRRGKDWMMLYGPSEAREATERALAVHPQGCPAHESVKGAIAVSWDATLRVGDETVVLTSEGLTA